MQPPCFHPFSAQRWRATQSSARWDESEEQKNKKHSNHDMTLCEWAFFNPCAQLQASCPIVLFMLQPKGSFLEEIPHVCFGNLSHSIYPRSLILLLFMFRSWTFARPGGVQTPVFYWYVPGWLWFLSALPATCIVPSTGAIRISCCDWTKQARPWHLKSLNTFFHQVSYVCRFVRSSLAMWKLQKVEEKPQRIPFLPA